MKCESALEVITTVISKLAGAAVELPETLAVKLKRFYVSARNKHGETEQIRFANMVRDTFNKLAKELRAFFTEIGLPIDISVKSKQRILRFVSTAA